MKINKRLILSLIITGICVVSVFWIGTFSDSQAVEKEYGSIGVVNVDLIIQNHPAFTEVIEAYEQAWLDAEHEYFAKMLELTAEELYLFGAELDYELYILEQTLMEETYSIVEKEIAQVSEEKGIELVIDNFLVIYGGYDFTEEVFANILDRTSY